MMTRLVALAVIAAGTVLAALGVPGCSDGEGNSSSSRPDLPKLTVGIQISPAMTLVMVAEDAGLFDKAGVDVEIKEFTAGKFALQAFLGGSLDVAVSGEVPVTLSTLQGNRFRVIAQVVERTTNECRIVVRREPGLDTPKAYFGARKRKLATSFGGGPEFYTYSFLEKHGIPKDQVELVSQKPENMPATLLSGSVDGISIFDPFARIAEVRIGAAGRTFSDPDIYSELYVVDVRDETIAAKQNELMAFLRGLLAAHEYIEKCPDESKKILIRYTKLDRKIVDDIWGNFVFKPVLNQRLLNYTTAQAKWAVAEGKFPPSTKLPDFRAVIYPDLLRSIDRHLVSVE